MAIKAVSAKLTKVRLRRFVVDLDVADDVAGDVVVDVAVAVDLVVAL